MLAQINTAHDAEFENIKVLLHALKQVSDSKFSAMEKKWVYQYFKEWLIDLERLLKESLGR